LLRNKPIIEPINKSDFSFYGSINDNNFYDKA